MKRNPCITSSIIGWSLIFIVIAIFIKGVFTTTDFSGIVYSLFFFAFIICGIFSTILLARFVKEIQEQTLYFIKHKTFNTSKKDKNIFNNIFEAYTKTFDSDKLESGLSVSHTNADLYFNTEELCSENFSFPILPIFNLIAGTFVGLGILGTFIGFTSGIPNSASITDTKQLDPLFAGLKIAFNTSIIGVFASVLYNFFILHPIINALNCASKALCDEIDSQFYISNNEDIKIIQNEIETVNSTISENLTVMSIALTSSITEMSSTMDKTMKEFGGGIKDSVNGALDKALENGREALNAAMTDSANKLTKVSEILNKTPEVIESVNNATEELSKKLEQAINHACKQTEAQLDIVITKINTALNENLSSFTENLKPASEKISEASEIIVNELPVKINKSISVVSNNVNDKMNGILTSFNSKIDNSLNNFMNRLDITSDSIKTVTSAVSELPSKISENFDKTMQNTDSKISETFNTLNDSIKISLDDFATKMQGTSDSISKIPSELNKSFESVTQAAQNNISKVLDGFNTNLENSLGEFTKQLVPATENIRQFKAVVQDVPGTIKNIQQGFLDSEKEIERKLKETSNSLSSSLNTVTSSFDTMMSKLRNTLDTLQGVENDMASLVSASKDKLDDILKNLSDTTDKYNNLNISTKNIFDGFKDVNDSLRDVFKSIEGALQNYTEHTNKTLSSYMNSFADGAKSYTDTYLNSVEEVKHIEQRIANILERINDAQKDIINLPDIIKKIISQLSDKKENN